MFFSFVIFQLQFWVSQICFHFLPLISEYTSFHALHMVVLKGGWQRQKKLVVVLILLDFHHIHESLFCLIVDRVWHHFSSDLLPHIMLNSYDADSAKSKNTFAENSQNFLQICQLCHYMQLAYNFTLPISTVKIINQVSLSPIVENIVFYIFKHCLNSVDITGYV